MRGHQALIAMRRRGMRPQSVSISVDKPDPCAKDWQDWASFAAVEVEATESVPLLDLRFCVGMMVFVDGMSRQRCEAVEKACRAAGASKVVTHVIRLHDRLPGEFKTTMQMIDGVVTFEDPSWQH